MKKSIIALTLAVVLVIGVAVGGTIAWLTDTTDAVTNTFTVGNIEITLEETTSNYKMIPGETIEKDPVITVMADSEACWLFVKVDESDNLSSFISYTIADGWTALDGVDGVYYRSVEMLDADQEFAVLAGDMVSVLDSVTAEDMDALTDNNLPTLTFTAYAIQSSGFEGDANAAWIALGE